MDNTTKIWLIAGIVAVMAAAVLFVNGGITGTVIGYCSQPPEVTSIKMVGNSVSVDWKDTSAYNGQIRYEALLFKKGADDSYNFDLPLRSTTTTSPFASFKKVSYGTYVAKVRAKNNPACSISYSDYAISEEIVYTGFQG